MPEITGFFFSALKGGGGGGSHIFSLTFTKKNCSPCLKLVLNSYMPSFLQYFNFCSYTIHY